MAQCIIKYRKSDNSLKILKEGTKPVIFPNRAAASNYIRNHYKISHNGQPKIIDCDAKGKPLTEP